MKRMHLSLLAIAITIGCKDAAMPVAPIATSSTKMVSDQVAPVASGDLVATPNGWYHRSCVHEIPNGAHVDINGEIHRKDGKTYQLSSCTQPGRVIVANQNRTVAPTINGWLEWADFQPGYNLGEINASWHVPAAPAGSYCVVFCSSYQTFYTFPGLQSSSYIVQPVLQYGYNGDYGGEYWTLASWHCNSGSDCHHSTPISASPGDSIVGSVHASGCANGICAWTISTIDVTKGTRTDYTIDDTQSYGDAVGGAMEVYNLSSCDQFPAGGVLFTGISLFNSSGQQVTPSWFNLKQSAPNPNCDFAVSSTTSTVSVHSNWFSVSISGPIHPPTPGSYTWTANPVGGFGSYTYEWMRDDGSGLYNTGVTSQSYTGYIPAGTFVVLQVTVTSGSLQKSVVKGVFGPGGCLSVTQGSGPNIC